MFTPPVVLVDAPAKGLAQGVRTGVLRINPVGREGGPDALVGRRHRNRFLAVTVTLLVDEDQPGVIGGDLQLPPYPPGQLQEVAVHVDRSFFPGLALPDDELIRLDLLPPQLEDVPNPEAEVNAGPDQQGGVVAAVGHQALDEVVGLGPPEGGGGAVASRFCHVFKVRPGGYKNRRPRR